MNKKLCSSIHRKNSILQPACMLLICLGLIAGTARDIRAAISNTTTAPELESVEVVGGDFVLTWSQPENVYGTPDGGYDIFIDGVDTNKQHRTSSLSATISGLAPGEHTFQVEARYTETREFNRSNIMSAVLEESTSIISQSTTAPVLESVEVVGGDFLLTWSQPENVYGAPDGGYDIFIDGVDQNNHLSGLSTTVSGLAPGEHTFQVEARYIETDPKEFKRSNVVSALLEESTQEPAPAPEETNEEPAVSETTTAPVLESVEVVGGDFVLTWSLPESVYGAPDGGYDIFIDGVDQNNHLSGLSTTVSGLAPGEHTFQVEARYIETDPKEFKRSNVVSAVSGDSVDPEPTLPPQITLAWDPSADPQVIGYRLYYKESSTEDPSYNTQPFDSTGLPEGGSPIDVGLNATYTLSMPYDTTVFCFAVTAYNADGLESGYSDIACTQ